jgi:hypothetical protein
MEFSAKVPKVLALCGADAHKLRLSHGWPRMYRHSLLRCRAVNGAFTFSLTSRGRLETTYPECTPLIIRSPCQLSDWGRFFPGI